AGTVTAGGSFDQGAGTVSTAAGNNPIHLLSGSSLDFTGTGAGAFQFDDPSTDSGTLTLTGNLAATQSLDFPAEDFGHGSLTDTLDASGSFTNAGTLTFDQIGGASNSSSEITLPAGDTLTNSGTINFTGDPNPGSASADNRVINANLDNTGTINVGATGHNPAFVVLAAGNTLINTSTFNVLSANTFLASGPVTGANPVPAAAIANDAGGAITSEGNLDVQGTFTEDAGTVATAGGDSPVYMQNGSSLGFTGGGASAFEFNDSTTDS